MRRLGFLSLAGVVLSLLTGVFLGVSAYTFYYARGFSYMSNDPKACVNCHIMREEYDGWQKASHHAVAVCNDCHLPHDPLGKLLVKASNGYHHSRAFTFQDFHEPVRIRPGNAQVLEELPALPRRLRAGNHRPRHAGRPHRSHPGRGPLRLRPLSSRRRPRADAVNARIHHRGP